MSNDKISLMNEYFDSENYLYNKSKLFAEHCLYLMNYKELDFEKESKEFDLIISNAKNEVDVQRYIKSNKKWFIPGSIFLDYNFGHKETYLFPEQKLGNDYVADYMLIGKESGGYSLILVEFETPNTEYLISTANMESESVRRGLTQLQDWKRWIDSNREYFIRNIGLREFGIDIPTYRTFYYLVVSRRKYMNKMAVEVRGQNVYERHNTKIVTFDRLTENVMKLGNRIIWM